MQYAASCELKIRTFTWVFNLTLIILESTETLFFKSNSRQDLIPNSVRGQLFLSLAISILQ